jgi:hypothetical protein
MSKDFNSSSNASLADQIIVAFGRESMCEVVPEAAEEDDGAAGFGAETLEKVGPLAARPRFPGFAAAI